MYETAFLGRGVRLIMTVMGIVLIGSGIPISFVATEAFLYHGASLWGGALALIGIHVFAGGLGSLVVPGAVRRRAQRRASLLRETSSVFPSYERPLAVIAPLAITWNVWMIFFAYVFAVAGFFSGAPPGVEFLFRWAFPALGALLLCVLAYDMMLRYCFHGWRVRLSPAMIETDAWVSFELLVPDGTINGGRNITILLAYRQEVWSVGGGYWHGYGRARPFPAQMETPPGPSRGVIAGRFRVSEEILKQWESIPDSRVWLFLCVGRGRWLKCLFELPLGHRGSMK
jgi:hypothetical protein